MMPVSEENRRLVEAVYGRDNCSTILRMLSARGFTLDRLLNGARAEERAKAQALGGGKGDGSSSAESGARLASQVCDTEAQHSDGGLNTYQVRVHDWMMACFGEAISADPVERCFRFLEEALELVQAQGCTADEAARLVDYVYGRPVGEARQEVGGVAVCLAALCTAAEIGLADAAEAELARVWTKVEKIRAKHASKPQGVRSSLPGVTAPDPAESGLSGRQGSEANTSAGKEARDEH